MEDPISRVVEPVARLAAIVCGYAVLLLSLAVSVEIIVTSAGFDEFQSFTDITPESWKRMIDFLTRW